MDNEFKNEPVNLDNESDSTESKSKAISLDKPNDEESKSVEIPSDANESDKKSDIINTFQSLTENSGNKESESTQAAPPPLKIEYTPNTQPTKPPQKAFAVAGLVIGIVSIICCCCNEYITIFLSAIAIAFFFVDKKVNGTVNGMAIAGLVGGIFSLTLSVFALIISSTSFYKDLLATYESAINSYMSGIDTMQ